jgi:hypothetical protein
MILAILGDVYIHDNAIEEYKVTLPLPTSAEQLPPRLLYDVLI